MGEWRDVHNQLSIIMTEEGFGKKKKNMVKKPEPLSTRLHKSIMAGYLSQAALQKDKNIYLAPKEKKVMIFPGSGLFNKGGKWIVAAEMVETTRLYARMAANIDPAWLEEIGYDLVKKSWSAARWDKSRGQVIADERVSLFGLPIVEKRTVSFGNIKPSEASEIFIRGALLEGQVKSPPKFLIHNRRLVKKVRNMEDRLRTRDILAPEEKLADFYRERIASVHDMPSLHKLIRKKGGSSFLFMKEDIVLACDPDLDAICRFPDHIEMSDRSFSLSYKFRPGKEDDGMTVNVPIGLIDGLDHNLDWMTPGFLKEKVTALIKGLPKAHRKKLVPVNKAVENILPILDRNKSLFASLGKAVYEIYGITIPATAWPKNDIPDHLRTRIGVVGEDGREIKAGRNLGQLRQELSGKTLKAGPVFEKARKKWERHGIISWDFDNIPTSIPLRKNKKEKSYAFPGLAIENGKTAILLFDSMKEAGASHKKGVELLFSLHLAKESKHLKKALSLSPSLDAAARPFGGKAKFSEDLYKAIISQSVNADIRSKEDFLNLVDEKRPGLYKIAAKKLELSVNTIKAHEKAHEDIIKLRQKSPENPVTAKFFSMLQKELASIMPKNFLLLYDDNRIVHLKRYMEAIVIRGQRGVLDLLKDGVKAKKASVHTEKLMEMAKGLDIESSSEKRSALEEFFWMIEEFKVMLFAPELKCIQPVSEKRLTKMASDIMLML